MHISLNPTYLCNFRCPWCYLTPNQLSDKQKIDLKKLDILLSDVYDKFGITNIDLYGGEIGLLSESYLIEMINCIDQYYQGPINIITNFSKIHPIFLNERINVGVSYDYDIREKHEIVFQNILMFPKQVDILMLASKSLLESTSNKINELIELFSNIHNIKSVEIKPYSTNQANQDSVTFLEFERYIIKWLKSPINKQFRFVNQYNIELCLSKQKNAFSDDHIYITPNGKYAVLEFDINDNEYFKEFNDLDYYLKWVLIEKDRIINNGYCGKCEFLGNCLSEHLRKVKTIINSCNGFKGLLLNYKEK